ncbi:hypothetical protein G7050_07465 [Dysgonomonas sp. HDW5A]|uniref:hypothetical protein n=1 Tax=Dysgonomonas sp. HDW5A TaxID=2714926 RepID=UPI001409CB42|nr:hypothetical protein [Dysgonomonas sp. HDW5A]QIK59678.1 hypothetical protein G7050_07465 [Dysgonomonas sp. HDW5A]
MTKDILFGYVTNLSLIDYSDKEKLEKAKLEINKYSGSAIVIGSGSSLVVSESAYIIYIDMAHWEIIQRFRRQEVHGLGIDDIKEPVSIQHKGVKKQQSLQYHYYHYCYLINDNISNIKNKRDL